MKMAAARLARPRAHTPRAAETVGSTISYSRHQKGVNTMSNDRSGQKPQEISPQSCEDIKRRDLLLSGGSLLTAAALSGSVLSSSVNAQMAAAPQSSSWPDASTTGVPAGASLTPSGNLNTSSNGQIIQGLTSMAISSQSCWRDGA
jgi:hypothetical protein